MNEIRQEAMHVANMSLPPEAGTEDLLDRAEQIVVFLDSEFDAKSTAIRELYEFIIGTLDPHPAPVSDYITDKYAAQAARVAVGAADLVKEDDDAT